MTGAEMTDLMPDLQEWIASAGGYHRIDWTAWDKAVAAARAEYQRRLESEHIDGRR